MSYLIEQPPETRTRVAVDMDRFVADLRHCLGHLAYVERVPPDDPASYGSVIRFKRQDYQLRFKTGSGLTGGPGRVWIECQLIAGSGLSGPIEVLTVSAKRPMSDIVHDLHRKILDRIDDLLPATRNTSKTRDDAILRRVHQFASDFPDLQIGAREAEGVYLFRGMLGDIDDEPAIFIQGEFLETDFLKFEITATVSDALFADLYAVLKKYNGD